MDAIAARMAESDFEWFRANSRIPWSDYEHRGCPNCDWTRLVIRTVRTSVANFDALLAEHLRTEHAS